MKLRPKVTVDLKIDLAAILRALAMLAFILT